MPLSAPRHRWIRIALLALGMALPQHARAVVVSVSGPVPCGLDATRLGALADPHPEGTPRHGEAHVALSAAPSGVLSLLLKDARGTTLFHREIDPRGSSCESLTNSIGLLARLWLRSVPKEPAPPHHRARVEPAADAGPEPLDAGATPDAGAQELDAGAPDAGPPPPIDAGPPPEPIRPIILVEAPPPSPPPPDKPLFGETGLGAGVYAATALGIDGLWIPTWFGGTAELVRPGWRLRLLAAQGRAVGRSAGAGTLTDRDLFGSVRGALPLRSSGFALEGGLRLDRLDVSTSGLAQDGALVLWDPGVEAGMRWRRGVGPACWVDLGAMASARAHRRSLDVAGVGTVLTVPALWISPEILGGCRIF